MQTFFILLLSALSIFMILLILIQRGKGGGLAGAFGGMGGQSAFGTKAGDTFTKITIVVALLWFILCSWSVYQMTYGGAGGRSGSFGSGQPPVAPVESTTDAPAPASEAVVP